MVSQSDAQAAAERSGPQLQLSPLLLCSLAAAVATTVALVVVAALGEPRPPPPPVGAPFPPPPPPSDMPLIVTTGFFTLAWLAVIVAFCRDQILRRIGVIGASAAATATAHEAIRSQLAAFRQDVARDRQSDLAELATRIAALTAEYGEQRETEGYLNGMRAATQSGHAPSADVRPLHRLPPAE